MAYLKKVYSVYEEKTRNFHFLKFIPVNLSQGEMPLYAEVLCKKREQLIYFLASHHIETRPFYPDLNTASYLGISGEFPNARVFGEQGLVLPCGPEQSFENINRVIEVLQLFGENNQWS
jgi:dTDP-4-amino-4,6-dideoxygalactose transaminase